MFIEITEIARHPETGEEQRNPMMLNTRYIGCVYRGDNCTHIIVDKNLLEDNATIVAEDFNEVMRRINQALYGPTPEDVESSINDLKAATEDDCPCPNCVERRNKQTV